MPLSVRKLVVHALCYSVIRYGISIYGHGAQHLVNRVNSILRGILKNVAYDLPPHSDVFKTLSLPDFNSLLLETVVLKHFWTSQYKIPYVPARCLRPKNPYITPRCNTRYGRRLRNYYVPEIFNSLPRCLNDVKTKGSLKKGLRRISLWPEPCHVFCVFRGAFSLSFLLTTVFKRIICYWWLCRCLPGTAVQAHCGFGRPVPCFVFTHVINKVLLLLVVKQ